MYIIITVEPDCIMVTHGTYINKGDCYTVVILLYSQVSGTNLGLELVAVIEQLTT